MNGEEFVRLLKDKTAIVSLGNNRFAVYVDDKKVIVAVEEAEEQE